MSNLSMWPFDMNYLDVVQDQNLNNSTDYIVLAILE